jgi:molybdenum cofactor synthesis domain-containing protein
MTVRIAVLTISDAGARGEREDRSGFAIATWARARGYEVMDHRVVPDEVDRIVHQLILWADDGDAKIILTTGGTGLGPRDVTPEATRAVIEREAPGLAEALRGAGLLKTPRAVLSRGVAGIRGNALIVNLPGSTSGVEDGLACLAPLVEHIVRLLDGDTEH